MFQINEKNRKWWILFAMTSAISVIFLDITVLPVALPTIQRTLGFSDLGLQWIVNSYTLALSVFVMAGGKLGDRIGHRKIFFIGLALFGLGSALCGLSHSEWFFISSRLIQGVGAAMLNPSALAIVFGAFPPSQRGKALGFYISIGSIFLATGPFIGGVFSQYWSWRFIFWINIPVLLVGFLLARFAVPASKKRHVPFDWGGFLMYSLGISAIVIALMQAQVWGWFSPLTVGLIVIGALFLMILYRLDSNPNHPFIEFSLFRNRIFTGSLLATFMAQACVMITIFWAIYFQNALGFSPSQAGTLTLLANIPIILTAPLGGHLLDKHGPRLPITIGFILVSGSLLWFTQILDSKSIPLLLTALIPFGIGAPFIFGPCSTTALAEITPEKRGLGTATISMTQQLAATLGLAILGTIFLNIQMGRFSADIKQKIDVSPDQFQGLLAKKPEALDALKSLSESSQELVTTSFSNAYVDAFFSINVIACFLALAGLTFTLILIRKKNRPKIDDAF